MRGVIKLENKGKTAKHFTVETYPENGWTMEKIKETLDKHTVVKQYAVILHDRDVTEDGTPIKPHFYIYINFGKSSVSRTDVARWFDIRETLVENVKSNKRQAIRYAVHLDQPDKHQYTLDEVTANFNIAPFLSN